MTILSDQEMKRLLECSKSLRETAKIYGVATAVAVKIDAINLCIEEMYYRHGLNVDPTNFHYHIAGAEGQIDTCLRCGKNIRDAIHISTSRETPHGN